MFTMVQPTRAAPSAGDARSEVIALAHRVVDAFNKGDMGTVASLMAAGDQSIIDEMPPFIWRGAGATEAWLADVAKDADLNKDTDSFSVLGPPTFIRIEGDRAYAVFPDHFTYKRHGVRVNEDARWTFTAQNSPTGWHIVATSFSAGAH